MNKEILDTLKNVMAYRRRVFKLPKSTKLPAEWREKEVHTGVAYYSFVINRWMASQPDSGALMKLFILCDLDMMRFVRLIIDAGPGTRKTQSERKEA